MLKKIISIPLLVLALIGLMTSSDAVLAKGVSASQIRQHLKKYKQQHGVGKTDVVNMDVKDTTSKTLDTQDGTYEIGKTDLQDYEPGQEPKEGKPVPQILLESLKLGNKQNLAFAATADMVLLHQLMEWLKKAGKGDENLLEEVLRIYATNGKKDRKTLTRYLNEMMANSNFPSRASVNVGDLQTMLDYFFVHPQIGHFSLKPGMRQIVRSQIRALLVPMKKHIKDYPKLKELHKEMAESLRIKAHDLYLVVILSGALEFAQKIPATKFKPMLLGRMAKGSFQTLQALQWSSDQEGAYTVR